MNRQTATLAAALLLTPILSIAASFTVHPHTLEDFEYTRFKPDGKGGLINLGLETVTISREILEADGLIYDEEGLLIDQNGALLTKSQLGGRLSALSWQVAWAPERFEMADKTSVALVKQGFRYDDRGTLTHIASGQTITREDLKKVDLDYDAQGFPAYRSKRLEPRPHSPTRMIFTQYKYAGRRPKGKDFFKILETLLKFKKAADLNDRDVGQKLTAWGIPTVFNGTHIINPDGSATYYGLMLYNGLTENPNWKEKITLTFKKDRTSALGKLRAENLSGENLEKALSRFQWAYEETFEDTGTDDEKRAWGYGRLRTAHKALQQNEIISQGTPLKKQPTPLPILKELRRAAEIEQTFAGKDSPKAAELAETIQTLNALEKQRYHKDLTLKNIPSPDTDIHLPHEKMPSLLKNLERVLGAPLTETQQEAVIKAFPMGETVWRMNAHKLWKKGLTGKGVKVAVIDSGAADNKELRDAIKHRTDLINRAPVARTWQPNTHGTHVSGTIHALAPEAEINSYAIFGISNSPRHRIQKAIDTAVADGNNIISMSLGGPANPSKDAYLKFIEKYVRQGVIFVISAGNDANEHGVGAPGIAEGAITVGALDANGRMADFSSYGEVKGMGEQYRFKTLYMAPGTRIVSTKGLGEENGYRANRGTSMATPHVSGVSALLYQQIQDMSSGLNPVQMSERLRTALRETAPDMDRSKMPSDLPPRQDVVIVDSVAAYKRLLAGS